MQLCILNLEDSCRGTVSPDLDICMMVSVHMAVLGECVALDVGSRIISADVAAPYFCHCCFIMLWALFRQHVPKHTNYNKTYGAQ